MGTLTSSKVSKASRCHSTRHRPNSSSSSSSHPSKAEGLATELYQGVTFAETPVGVLGADTRK
jgi:hypothetical protein